MSRNCRPSNPVTRNPGCLFGLAILIFVSCAALEGPQKRSREGVILATLRSDTITSIAEDGPVVRLNQFTLVLPEDAWGSPPRRSRLIHSCTEHIKAYQGQFGNVNPVTIFLSDLQHFKVKVWRPWLWAMPPNATMTVNAIGVYHAEGERIGCITGLYDEVPALTHELFHHMQAQHDVDHINPGWPFVEKLEDKVNRRLCSGRE